MKVHELREMFLHHKSYLTDCVNELLDFTKKAYIHNEISISDYRNLIRELESRGANNPEENNEYSISKEQKRRCLEHPRQA